MRRSARGFVGALAVLAGLVALVAGCATPAADRAIVSGRASPVAPTIRGTTVETLVVGGVPRSVTVIQPGDGRGLVPAVIMLHGAGGSPERIAEMSGIPTLAADGGFVVAVPKGEPLRAGSRGFAWNAGACCGTPASAGVDDVGFLDAVVLSLVSGHGVDPERVYLAGFSNGGMLAYKFVCDSDTRIAGIAVVGGAQNTPACRAPHPTPVIIVHGTADPTVPYEGGYPRSKEGRDITSWINTPVAFAEAFWAERNGCPSARAASLASDIALTTYTGCASPATVQVVTISGGDHDWPGEPGWSATDFILQSFGLQKVPGR